MQALLAHERSVRTAERTGRIRAEQKLRRLQLDAVLSGSNDNGNDNDTNNDSASASAGVGDMVAASATNGSVQADVSISASATIKALAASRAAAAGGGAAGAAAAVHAAPGGKDARPMAATSGAAAPRLAVYPCRPVGHIHSCFTEK